jgi:hypothetical protein
VPPVVTWQVGWRADRSGRDRQVLLACIEDMPILVVATRR